MKITLEAGDREYFESQIGEQIPDDVWSQFEDWIQTNMYGTLIDQCVEQIQENL